MPDLTHSDQTAMSTATAPAPAPISAQLAEVGRFIADIVPATRQADCRALGALMQEVSGEPPRMWGSMVGFGRYRYRYDSGREGETFLIGFASRRDALTVYLGCELGEHANLLGRMGRYKAGKGCLYLRQMADVDAGVLRSLLEHAVASHRGDGGGATTEVPGKGSQA
jgi:hypothetical protein